MNTLGAKNIHISVPVHCFYQHLLTDIWKFQSVLVYISKDTAKKCLYIYIWDILSVLYLENCIVFGKLYKLLLDENGRTISSKGGKFL